MFFIIILTGIRMKRPEHPAAIDLVSVYNTVFTVKRVSGIQKRRTIKTVFPVKVTVQVVLAVAFPLHDRIRNTGFLNLQPANPVWICYLCGKNWRNGIYIPLLLDFLQLVKTIFLFFVILVITVYKIYQQKKEA